MLQYMDVLVAEFNGDLQEIAQAMNDAPRPMEVMDYCFSPFSSKNWGLGFRVKGFGFGVWGLGLLPLNSGKP